MASRSIMCFGDSNTHGTMAMRHSADRRRLPRDLRWPSVMAQALGDGWDVLAEGHPGRTSVFADPIEGSHKNGQQMLPALLETHRPLDLVIVMLGTNDLKARFGAPAHDIALGLQRLVVEIAHSDCGPDDRAPDILLAAPVIVQEVGIFEQTFAGASAKSRALPALLRGVAARQAIAFANLNAVATVDPVDGIHLDATAHARIGAALAEAVPAALTTQQERNPMDAQRN